MKNKVLSGIFFFITFVFFSCTNGGLNPTAGKISISNLPYGISKLNDKISSDEDFVEPVQVSYVYHIILENEQKTEKQEKIAYSSESILFEDLNPDMWTVTVAASDIEYEEQLQQLIDNFGSDIYNRDNSKSDFSFFIAQAKVEVKAGEVSEALLKLKRVLIESQKIVGITVETATSLYDVITFENFDSFVQEGISAKLIIETYLGNELIRTDYDEIPAENIYVSEISEKDVGYVPVTVECVAEGEIYSNTVRIPVTFNYPVPDYDLDFFKTSYDVLECSDLIVNGDPFGREYSDVLVNYYPETAKESEEIVLVMEPEKISWYKEGKIIKEEKTVESKDGGKILNFEIAIDTDQVGTSVYYCAVDYNIIAKTTSEVLDFITPLTATLTSPEFTVEVHDGETLKELSALSVTPREEEFSVKAGSQLRSEDFKFEVTYKLTKGTSVVYKTEEIPSSLWELDSIPSNVIGKYPYRFWIENEYGFAECETLIPVCYEVEAPVLGEITTSYKLPLYDQIEIDCTPENVGEVSLIYYSEEPINDTNAFNIDLSVDFEKAVWSQDGTAKNTTDFIYVFEANSVGSYSIKSEFTYNTNLSLKVDSLTEGETAQIIESANNFIVNKENLSVRPDAIEVTVYAYNLNTYILDEDSGEFTVYEGKDFESGKTYKLVVTNEAPDSEDYVKEFISWTYENQDFNTNVEGCGITFTVPEFTASAQTAVFVASIKDNKLFECTVSVPEGPKYTITFYANDGTSNSVTQTFNYKEEAALISNKFTNGRYKFIGWALTPGSDEVAFTNEEVISIEEDLSLYAIWILDVVTVKFDAGDSAATGEMFEITAIAGTEIELPAVEFENENYIFAGWALSPNGEKCYDDGDSVTVNADLTLFALWKLAVYTITFDTNGGNEIENYEYTYGDYVNLNNFKPVKEGYNFVGWSYLDKIITTVPAGDIILKAVWEAGRYQVIFEPNGGTLGEISPSYMYTYGEKFELPVPTKEGYTFLNWETETGIAVETSEDIPFAEVNQTIKLTATWKINTYTVTFINGLEITKKSVEYNSTVEKPEQPQKENYTFVGWFMENGTEFSFDQTIMADLTLEAKWQAPSAGISVVFTPVSSGVSNTLKVSYDVKEDLIVFTPSVENSDVAFFAWTVDGSEKTVLGDTYSIPSEFTGYVLITCLACNSDEEILEVVNIKISK